MRRKREEEDSSDSNKDDSSSDDYEEEEEESELVPYRPELEKVSTQKLKFLIPPSSGPKHPKTLFFINDPKINQNKYIKGANFIDVEILDKKYMILFKAYKNIPLCLSEPMKYNHVIRSKLFDNTNIIWKLMKSDQMLPFLRELNPYQRFNHFPMTRQLSKKDNLYKNFMKMKNKFPKDFNYMPETFIFPKDRDAFMEKVCDELDLYDKEHLWIIKPCASSRGRGIRLLTDLKTIPKRTLISHYISNPHLINGKKYDLRIYLLITGFCPLKIYIYNNGLVRFCSEEYNLDPERMNDRYIHLTNYSINKTSEYFEKNDSVGEEYGNKWTIETLRKYFYEQGIDFEKIWIKIKDILIKVIISVADCGIQTIKQFSLASNNLFEIYGIDILLDDRLNPWLMEVNLNPSLNCDSKLDLKVKSQLLTDVFNIIGVIPFSHDGKFTPLDKVNEYKNSIEEAVIESLCEFARPSGGFERIFPKKDNIYYYSQFINDPEEENYALWEKMKRK